MYFFGVSVILFVAFVSMIAPLPQQQKSKRPVPVFKKKAEGLQLPNNATAIRENIIDNFSCDERIYGYYADIENECQIFHVCMPNERGSMRWSFICPAETVFNQATFVCTRTESSIPCEESENYYSLNEDFGKIDENENENENENEKPENSTDDADIDQVSSSTTVRSLRRGKGRNIAETTVEIQQTEVTVPSIRNGRISSRYRA